MMKRWKHKSLVVLFSVFILLISSCRVSTSVSSGLSADDAVLAKKSGDTWELMEEDTYEKGDVVGLVILNVSGFKKDEDDLNWMDINVEVKGPDGEVVLDEKELLGESGHIDLENNIAESPVGSFYTTAELESGRYVIKVTVYDRIGKGSVINSKSFVLE